MTTAKKTIHADTYLNFGKYKGDAVESVLMRDPGYFLWCQVAGVANLSATVEFDVKGWAETHPGDAAKVVRSASKAKRENAREATLEVAIKAAEDYDTENGVEPPPPPPAPVMAEAWGTW